LTGDGEPNLPLYQTPSSGLYGQIPRPQFTYGQSPWQQNDVSQSGQKERPSVPFSYIETYPYQQKPNITGLYPVSGQYSVVNYYGQNSYQPAVPKPTFSYGYGSQSYGQGSSYGQSSKPQNSYGQSASSQIKPYRPHGQSSFVQSQFSYGPNQVAAQKDEKPSSSFPSKPSFVQHDNWQYGGKPEDSYDPLPPFVGQDQGYDKPPQYGQSFGPLGDGIDPIEGKLPVAEDQNQPLFVQSESPPEAPEKIKIPLSYGEAPNSFNYVHNQNPSSQSWQGPFSASHQQPPSHDQPFREPSSSHSYGQKPFQSIGQSAIYGQRPPSGQFQQQASNVNDRPPNQSFDQPPPVSDFPKKPSFDWPPISTGQSYGQSYYGQKPSSQFQHEAIQFDKPPASDFSLQKPSIGAPLSTGQSSVYGQRPPSGHYEPIRPLSTKPFEQRPSSDFFNQKPSLDAPQQFSTGQFSNYGQGPSGGQFHQQGSNRPLSSQLFDRPAAVQKPSLGSPPLSTGQSYGQPSNYGQRPSSQFQQQTSQSDVPIQKPSLDALQPQSTGQFTSYGQEPSGGQFQQQGSNRPMSSQLFDHPQAAQKPPLSTGQLYGQPSNYDQRPSSQSFDKPPVSDVPVQKPSFDAHQSLLTGQLSSYGQGPPSNQFDQQATISHGSNRPSGIRPQAVQKPSFDSPPSLTGQSYVQPPNYGQSQFQQQASQGFDQRPESDVPFKKPSFDLPPSPSQSFGQPPVEFSSYGQGPSSGQFQQQDTNSYGSNKPSSSQSFNQPPASDFTVQKPPVFGQHSQMSSFVYGQNKPFYGQPSRPLSDFPHSQGRPQSSLASFIYGQGYGQPSQDSPLYGQPPPPVGPNANPAGQPLSDEAPPSQQVPPLLLDQSKPPLAIEPPDSNSKFNLLNNLIYKILFLKHPRSKTI